MKNRFINILVVLLVVISFSITGCSKGTSYQKGIFNDNKKIIKQGDSYTFGNKKGKSSNKESNIEFSSFTGMKTILNITASDSDNITIDFESKVKKGDFKVVLITPENEVVEIFNDTEEGSKEIKLKKGESRIKIVGKETKGEVKMTYTVGENVEIEGEKR